MTRDFIGYRTNGETAYCVTPEGLDRFWPTDDREVDITSAAFKLFSGHKGAALDTCDDNQLTYEEQVAPHDLLRFVFNGEEIHTTPPQVPTPEASILMATAVMAVLMAKVKTND